MPTAVLFAAPPPPGMAGPLLIGGSTVLDRQIRQVHRAGVARVLVVADRLADAATLNDDVLLIDPGVVLDDRIVAAMVATTAPAIATWPAARARGTERIDARDTAAGIALYPAALVRDTCATLGDWDLGATLLRRALAAGATRVDFAALPECDASLDRDEPLVWARPDDADSAASTTAALLAAAEPGCRDWVGRWLHAPVENTAVRLLLPLPVAADVVAVAGIAIAVAAAVGFATGWLWTGLLLALVCGPVAGSAAKLARVRVERSRVGGAAVNVAAFGWFAAAAVHFAAAGVDAWPLAALLTGFMLAERLQRGFFRRLVGRPLDTAGAFERRFGRVAARRDTLLWAWLPFAAFGQWTAGFAVLAAYATASFFVTQWRTFTRLAERR